MQSIEPKNGDKMGTNKSHECNSRGIKIGNEGALVGGEFNAGENIDMCENLKENVTSI